MKTRWWVKEVSIASVSLWLVVFALIPLLMMFVLSFMQHDPDQIVIWHFTFKNYTQLFSSVYLLVFVHSLLLALTATLLCLLLGYPAAFLIAQSSPKIKPILMLLLIIPFWTSSLIRTYAIMTLIKAKGLLNTLLISLGIIHHPLQILYTNTAVVLGLVYNLLPFMILPLYSNIEKLDTNIFEAAYDLGASKLRTLFKVTIPLTLPGIIAGVMLVFLPAMTLFYIPDILGGAKSLLLGNLIENQFLLMNNWPGGAATSVVMTLLMLLLAAIYRYADRNNKMDDLL